MSLDELKTQSGKFENLSKDTKLVNSLPDKGAKINEQLKLLQVLKSEFNKPQLFLLRFCCLKGFDS